ncbi:MAG: protease inhibitor I42 family protein [Thermoleophilia bacterium]|nr:protease inhibitor I42 family protein [Thermoleophilia bacterium]
MKKPRWYQVYSAIALVALVLALAAAAGSGCGGQVNATTGPVKLTEADNGKTITIKVGQTIEVTLPGNPTTGYGWGAALADKDKALLEQVGEPVYTQDKTDGELVGAGGTYTFTFRAKAAGAATLKLTYARPWETVEPLATYQVTVTIPK